MESKPKTKAECVRRIASAKAEISKLKAEMRAAKE